MIGLVGSETQDIQHFAEFGVVMMLFLVGLELQPRMLWQMRNRLIGLGGLQVGITTVLISAAALAMGVYWSVALTIGLIFSLSSTAIVLQTLNEKGLTKTEGGQASFSVLLFQDIAVIPISCRDRCFVSSPHPNFARYSPPVPCCSSSVLRY